MELDNRISYIEDTPKERLAKDTIMLAGRILLESGAEGTRVEGTMTRIAETHGFYESNSFVTNTVINFLLDNQTTPRMYRIESRDTNLIKISQTNSVSRKLSAGKIDLEEAYETLKRIYDAKQTHDLIYKGIAAAIISISFLYLQTGNFVDIVATIFAGSLGYLLVEMLYRANLKTLFIPEFLGSVVIGGIAILGHNLVPDGSLSAIIIAAVMPIVPGVLITNAIQDLFGGHMMMFTTKSLEALVTSFGIGAGVGTMLLIF
ncbi:threonine/serine exporter family protein [Staphylococcus simulans]|uniref:threonine/serine exporter family protein n=1 Tax=Staphylococcus simulans TaxID=1286 RepID=UPI002903C616|nr:threonine/serine exporter family protein [Staphylococcus simulans]MDU0420098.1 threonine/serine exporter family protein [Staphylococcus simulans]MDU0465956.1 threonine/serine exporter family protein [Staphylococcus simulans]